jgi:LPXTG-motif cell wall-anchored protein
MRRPVLVVLALSLGTLFSSAAIAAAAPPPKTPPPSGDPRATSFAGNVSTCAEAGLPGVEINVTSHITEKIYIDITAVPSGYTVTGVVVKGGDGYNRYPNLGKLPWDDLHPPLVSSGKPAEISHWFVCATKTTTTSTSTVKPPTSSSTSSTTSTKPPTSSSTISSGGAVVTPGSGSTPTAGGSELASTGFDGWPYLLGAAALLVAGGGALLFTRRRHS